MAQTKIRSSTKAKHAAHSPSSDLPAWQEVLVSLRRIIRATDMQSRRMAKESGLTIPQLVVMRAIESLGDVTVRRDGEASVLPEGNRKLEAVEWVHHDKIGYVLPEPATVCLLGLGGLSLLRRRKR